MLSRLRGAGIGARVLRGGALTGLGFAASQGLRLAANLVLARLLFPEAFGLMALVTVFMVGLAMFSDLGLGPSIQQSPRGDDPAFLRTAYTLQLLRGLVLWLAICALALPAARFYDAPELAAMMPVAGLALLIAGANPIRIETAARHLVLGRLTAIDLAAQTVGIAVMIGLALATGSVWALVAGGIATATAKLVLARRALPGEPDRIGWDPEAGRELIRFGKWIFLSTACGFMLAQGDKAILGRFLTMEALGIYNIGWFVASFPMLLAGAVVGRVMIPAYRENPPGASSQNFARLRRLRIAINGTTLLLIAVMALGGEAIVALLYDERYLAAGPIVVLVACAQLPALIGLGYDLAALAAGDSRNYFLVMAARAGTQTLGLLIGAQSAGVAGALFGQAVAAVVVYPAIVWLARRHRAWDAPHDIGFALAAAMLAAVALHAAWPGIISLAGS
ncbi:MAG: oligosaccharide flippase family protein [Gemmobacter sp.]